MHQKLTGAFFTPDAVAHTLVRWAVRRTTDRLLDPSCGDGRFISKHRKSVGIERDPVSAQAAKESAPSALVHEGDFFVWAGQTRERFDCIAGNPPFIRYQHFSGPTRQLAQRLCAQSGVKFSGLASSWAPFLVAAASLLKPGGRLAFVVPAEIGHAPYAAPLIEFLAANFSLVQVIAVRKKLFPLLSEDCWLLYADGYSASTSTILFTAVDEFEPWETPPQTGVEIGLSDWRDIWNCRLRPFLAPLSSLDAYKSAKLDETTRLGSIATVGIGYVSGDNAFFHLRPSEVDHWGISRKLLHVSVRNGKALGKAQLTKDIVERWLKSNEEVLLLKLPKDIDLPVAVRNYLDSDGGQRARQAYKCRTRSPWYSVPDVQVPDFMLTYMSGETPSLVKNGAGATCTNTLHSIRVRDYGLAKKFLPQWSSDLTQLSCEFEGHPLGGGMLKLEVREAARVLLPAGLASDPAHDAAFREGVCEMRRWRHYGS